MLLQHCAIALEVIKWENPDLRKASFEELASIKGIGETRSEARKEKGLVDRVSPKRYFIKRRKNKLEKYAVLGLISLLVVASIILIWYALLPGSRISIDGSIDDWQGVATYREEPSSQVPTIDIVEYGMLFEDRRINFFARTQGDVFATDSGVDVLRIFIDVDSKGETGYQYKGIGAEYKIEVSGWEGIIRSATLQSFSKDANRMNYSAWENAGDVRVEKSRDIVEGYIKITGLENPRAVFVMSHYEGQIVVEKLCSAPASSKYASLAVSQRYIGGDVVTQGDEVLEIKLVARGGEVNVNSISVENGDVVLEKNRLGKDEEMLVKATAKSLSTGVGHRCSLSDNRERR